MENLHFFVADHIAVLLAILTLLVIVLGVMLVAAQSKLNKLQKKYDFFTQGKEANIDAVLTEVLQREQRSAQELAELQKRHEALRQKVGGCIQTVRLKRYDAFEAMGGEMSYSLLLADENKNGVILTSIYGREDNRCYAKDITAGKSSYVLAEEEKKLL